MSRNTIEPALLTTSEAARLLGISTRTVALMAAAGDIPAVRIGPKEGGGSSARASTGSSAPSW